MSYLAQVGGALAHLRMRWWAARLSGGLPWLAALALLASACLPPAQLSPTPVPSPSATATITPTSTTTIVWFPPTATFTIFPTLVISPTVDFHPALGALILEDDYTDQAAWPVTRTETGSVAYGNQELTLAVAAPGGALLSLRQSLLLNDFYLEIDAEPSLCREGDTYGLLLRASSPLDYYRLMVNCSGQLRVDRLKNGKVTPVQDWMDSGQIPAGGMMRFRLGVAALKDEMHIFVNDTLLLSFRDPVWDSGQIGVYARSGGDTPLTVSFSRLMIYQLASGRMPPPTATARPVKPSPTVVGSPSPTRQP